MILMISGMGEGNRIYDQLTAEGLSVMRVNTFHFTAAEKMRDGLNQIFAQNQVELLLDASHAFPEGLSGKIRDICRDSGIPYIKYVRKELELPDSPLIIPVYTWEEAVLKSGDHGDTVFLTTGSYNLEGFLENPGLTGKRIVVRLLPNHKVIQRVEALGIPSKDIIAMQGPFTRELNRAMFKMYRASVIVTKDSGKKGGTDSKISAALSLNIPVVVIKRPVSQADDEVYSYQQILKRLRK